MAFTHTIRITELKKQKQLDEFSEVVVHCRWELKSFHEDHPEIEKTFPGATPFRVTSKGLSENFTPFEDLSEADLIKWVEATALNIPDLKVKHEQQINEEIEDPFEVVGNPWNHEDVAVPTPPIT